jgi:rod shape-determining protein MreD
MRSFVAIALAAVVAIVLQTAVFAAIPHLPVVPDLVLVLAAYLGVRHHGAGGAFGAFLLGYLVDTFSGTVLGMHAFALTAVYVAAYLIARHLWMEGGLPVMAVVFVGACVGELAMLAVAALVAAHAPLWQHVVRYGLIQAGAAALLGPAVFAFVGREKQLLGLS